MPSALRLPLLKGARFAAARDPGTRVAGSAARSLPPGGRLTHWSLSSPGFSSGFPLRGGSLGGIFGLEGGEPDPALDSIPPRQGGNGREVEDGVLRAREGGGRRPAGEGARLPLAS